ncbi:hypothetical protein [Agromyces cerinus]|uniref:Uncharacterized protein n=1 Tax=Agromyces cerinus subsp. cerinus TaxID=232089 RepID=A0A1N6F4S4_9MICO|nr:hypothetical protein [Agromyces cerinus]SIN90283.1 hypothetical protein SAMN05443544_1744 [Agromyces cerinus subsp. cerinus]
MSSTDPATAAAAPTPAAPPGPPSVHVRAVITWLAIFPLVAVGMVVIGPISESWHPVLRAFALTVVVVPLAVYLVVPRLLAAYGGMRRRSIARSGQGLH